MLKVSQNADCGNSPKNRLAANTEIALARGDTAFLREVLSSDVRWQIIGEPMREGREEVIQALIQRARNEDIREIIIAHAISHGKNGAVNGSMTRADGTRVDFCTFFTFSNAKGSAIRAIEHYAIPGPKPT